MQDKYTVHRYSARQVQSTPILKTSTQYTDIEYLKGLKDVLQFLEGGGHDDTKGPPEHTEAGGDWSINLQAATLSNVNDNRQYTFLKYNPFYYSFPFSSVHMWIQRFDYEIMKHPCIVAIESKNIEWNPS